MLLTQNYLNDPLLPYLTPALDGENIQHFCQALITGKVDASITSCRVAYLQYCRAEGCNIQYEMTLRQADETVQTHWLVGYQFADREKFRDCAHRLKKSSPLCVPDDGLLPGVVIEKIRLLVQCFPYDRCLPELAHFYLNIKQVITDHLEKLLGSKDWKLEKLDAQPVKWRVGMSAVIRLTLSVKHTRTGVSQRRNLYAKVNATKTNTNIMSRLQRLESTGRLPFDLPHTLLSIPQQGFTIRRSVNGLTMDKMLSDGTLKLADARQLARVLARWHTTGDSFPNIYSKEKFETALWQSVRALWSAAPACTLRLKRLTERISKEMHHSIYRPAHLDLKPEHIFFCADRITLIDIESAADADPMIDIAILCARLLHAKVLYGLPDIASHSFALQLTSTYHTLVPSSWWRNFSVCYAWALLKVAEDLFVCQRPDWLFWVDHIVNEAEMAMNCDEGRLPFLPVGINQEKQVDQKVSEKHILSREWSMG